MLTRWRLQCIDQALTQGGIIAYPTESVYGLGCDPEQPLALERLLNVKRRSFHKGLIILISNIDQALPYIQPLNEQQTRLILKNNARATTWLIPRSDHLPELLYGQSDRIAIRLTRHPIAKSICDYTDKALVSTSCNLSGKPPMKYAFEARNKMSAHIDQVVAGECEQQSPSKIIDLLTGNIIRN